MSAAEIRAGRLRMALLAALALCALLLGVAAMHASMIDRQAVEVPTGVSASSTMVMTTSGADSTAGGASADHAMGEMNLLDCLVLGMLRFLSAVAVLILALLLGLDHQRLSPRATAGALVQAVRGLSPPRPPSLLVLSISRT